MLDKYSHKIIKFIDTHFTNFDLPRWENDNITLFTNQISDLVEKTLQNPKYTVSKTNLQRIHNNDQYPLIFLFFCKLYEKNITHIFKTNFHNCNFKKFIIWYRENQNNLNLNSMHRYMNTLVNSGDNGSGDNGGGDNGGGDNGGGDNGSGDHDIDKELIDIYNIIYKPIHKARIDLHTLLYKNSFIPLDVQVHAETLELVRYVYTSADYILTLYCPLYNQKENSVDINKLQHIINFMINLAKDNNKQNNVANIIIFCGLQRKEIFFFEKLILCSDNINSGSSVPGKTVMIWRLEEIFKVLIHELVHFYQLDFNSSDENLLYLSSYLRTKYNVNGFDSPNESYTEFLAIIIHSVFVTHYTSYDIYKVLKYEIIFTLFQVAKILKFYGFKSTRDFSSIPVNQTTSVFSYFIIKGALLFSLPKVIEFVGANISALDIRQKSTKFIYIVQECMNEQYFDYIDKMIKFIYNIDISINNKFIMKTLRMSAFQI